MVRGVKWSEIQEKALFLLPHGLLGFLFLFFALPASKAVNLAFYLLVLLPTILAAKVLIKTSWFRPALLPIFAVIIFWALFSFVHFDLSDWGNVAKKFRHAFYTIAFISAVYYLLSINLVSVRKLTIYLFCLAVSYSFLCFIYVYWIEGRDLNVRMYPILRLDSPIYMAIILTVYGAPLMHWLSENKKRESVLLLFILMAFFLYFYKSRSAIVGLFSGILVMIFLAQSVNQKRFVAAIIILLLAYLSASYFFGNVFDRGTSYRIDIWLSGLKKAEGCGLFLGCGFGGNSEVTIDNGRTFQHSHNLFLSHLVNTGLLGLLSLLGLLGYVVYQGVKLGAMMALGLVVGVVGLFFDGNALLTNPDALWLIFWLPLIMTYWEVNNLKVSKGHFLVRQEV